MKETKTIQVYPSDDIVNATIEEYGILVGRLSETNVARSLTGLRTE